ncbi:hypothetical protein D3C75_1158080 [compost metagenome]
MPAGQNRRPLPAAHYKRHRRVNIADLCLRGNLGQEALQMLPDPPDPFLRHAVPEEQQRQLLVQTRLCAPGHPGLGMGPLRHPYPAAAAGLQPARQAVMVRVMMGNHNFPYMVPG